MSKIQKGLIEYNGLKEIPEKVMSFKEIIVENIFLLKNKSHDIAELVSVYADTIIKDERIIESKKRYLSDGKICTGKELLISGDIKMKYQYISDDKEETIYTAFNKFGFVGKLMLDDDFDNERLLYPFIGIDDIYSQCIDGKCIYNSLNLILSIDI